jgi:hypothetical protein
MIIRNRPYAANVRAGTGPAPTLANFPVGYMRIINYYEKLEL